MTCAQNGHSGSVRTSCRTAEARLRLPLSGGLFSRHQRKRQVLEKGISNLEFHYLSSAQILGGVGKGLAEAMAELKQLKKTN